jgi:hypothetical protein
VPSPSVALSLRGDQSVILTHEDVASDAESSDGESDAGSPERRDSFSCEMCPRECRTADELEEHYRRSG